MIPREEMVASHSLVEELIELGVNLPYNHFMWVEKKRNGWQVHFPGINQFNPKTMLPAPTVSELMPALPALTFLIKNSTAFKKASPKESSTNNSLSHKAQYVSGKRLFSLDGNTAPNALASLLILLLKEKAVKIDDVNDRLSEFKELINIRT